MSQVVPFVEKAYAQHPFPAIAAGKTGRPETIVGGVKATNAHIVFTGNMVAGDTVTIGSKVITFKAPAAAAVGKIVFTGNIVAGDKVVFNGYTFDAVASGAALASEFNVGVDLSASLDNLIAKLNACTDTLVSWATYTKTDTNTAVTATADVVGSTPNSYVFSSTHVSTVITQPAGGRDVAGADQIDVTGALSTDLDALVTKLNGHSDPTIALFTWTKTDTNTGLTGVPDAIGSNANVALATNHSTAVVTAPASGADSPAISLDTATTIFNSTLGGVATLPAGEDGQVKHIVNIGAGTVTVAGTFTGGTSAAIQQNEALSLVWLGTMWRVNANDGVTIS